MRLNFDIFIFSFNICLFFGFIFVFLIYKFYSCITFNLDFFTCDEKEFDKIIYSEMWKRGGLFFIFRRCLYFSRVMVRVKLL